MVSSPIQAMARAGLDVIKTGYLNSQRRAFWKDAVYTMFPKRFKDQLLVVGKKSPPKTGRSISKQVKAD